MSAEFPKAEVAPAETKEEKMARLRAELAALEEPEAPAEAPEAQAEAPAEATQEQAVETAAAPDPAVAERAAADTAALAATRERLGMPPPENAEQAVAETAKEDSLAGLTAEDYKEKFRFLKKGVDFPDLGARGSNEVLNGKTVGEWFNMTQEHAAESDRVRDALYEKAIDGTITPDQKQILSDYLIDHYAIQNGQDPYNGKSAGIFGPRWKELWESPAFAEVVARAKEESRKPGRTPL